jgi:hypothetical protein
MKQANKLYVLLLLILVFAAPGIAAYVFYQHPSWLGSKKVNKGTLLESPMVFNAFKGQSKWGIIFWTPKGCDTLCLNQLDVLARVRLALGRKLYQVDQWLILGDKASSLSAKARAVVKDLNFKVRQISASELNDQKALFSDSKVFLVDPKNYLILSYPPLVEPDDLYQDLKLLLTTTEKNG